MLKRLFLILFLLSVSIVSSGAAEKLSVFVSIVPQKYFVQQIGKERVEIQVMVKPGASPHIYEPRPRQMMDIANAKLYFAIGVQFENAWLEKIAAASPNMKVIHTDHGIDKLAMTSHRNHDEEHHDHAGLDPHTWTSPELVKVQAGTILKALQKTDPSNKKEYEKNFSIFAAKIDALDQTLKQTFSGKTGLQFMVFHPAWGYFADTYGLKQVPIEIEGKDSKPAQLKELIEHARKEGIKVIFVQPQFSTQSAKVVAREIGAEIAFADPLAEDWMANLRMIADKFKTALK